MIAKLIRRMINAGYSDDDIVLRLRCSLELVKAIRDKMKLEKIVDEDYDEE